MTGKDLILYILENDLENSPVYENNKFIGFMTVDEVALKLNIGVAAVCALIEREVLNHICVGNTLFIPANFNEERKKDNE
jgi:predicted transcriptional regulator